MGLVPVRVEPTRSPQLRAMLRLLQGRLRQSRARVRAAVRVPRRPASKYISPARHGEVNPVTREYVHADADELAALAAALAR